MANSLRDQNERALRELKEEIHRLQAERRRQDEEDYLSHLDGEEQHDKEDRDEHEVDDEQ